MLAKVVDLKKQFRGVDDAIEYALEGGQSLEPQASPAGDGVEYIAREGVVEVGTLNLNDLDPGDPVERKIARDMIDACARQGLAASKSTLRGSPIYHLILSWPPGEVPSRAQAQAAAQHALAAVGLGSAQAIYAVHRDKQHHHVHVLANRHDAQTHKVLGPVRFDYLHLDRACREIEVEQGWRHSPGPHVVVDGRVVHMSRAQRRRAGLLREDGPGDNKKIAARSGLPTLNDYLRGKFSIEKINRWDEFHRELGRLGVEARIVRSKKDFPVLMFVAPGGDGGESRVIASSVHREFSLRKLEAKFGAFETARERIDAQQTFARWLDDVAAGVEPAAGESPGITGSKRDAEKRAAARAERALARAALLERWKSEKLSARAELIEARARLRAEHAAQRKALGRPPRGASIEARLAAAQYVAARESMRSRHKIERAALEKKFDMSWRAWLERRAVLGDGAAVSALRGIGYREQRDRTRGRAGFEGEDLRLEVPAAALETEGAGSIGGELRRWSLSDARVEIDEISSIVRYLDDSGAVRVVDAGPRIELGDASDEDAMRAAMLLAAQRYGGQIFITGDADFRERAAREAVRAGIEVADADLQSIVQHEREIQAQAQARSRTRGAALER